MRNIRDLLTPDSSVPAAEPIGEREYDFGTSTWSSVIFTGAAVCPQDKVLPLSGGRAITVSYEPLCNFLRIFSVAIWLVAFFVAAMILTGQKASDTGG